MPPIGAAITLPPCGAERMRAHAEPHAELEDARERTDRRQADDERLQYAEPWICLHDAHETQHRMGGHETVGIERDGKFVPGAEAFAKVAHIAGLERGVHGAPPIGDRDRAVPLFRESSEAQRLRGDDVGSAAVAQEVDMEHGMSPRAYKPIEQRLEIADHLVRALVADAHENGGRRAQRLVAATGPGKRVHGHNGIAAEPHHEEADGGVPEAHNCPGQGDREERDEEDRAEAAWWKRKTGERQKPGHAGGDKKSEDCAAARERPRALGGAQCARARSIQHFLLFPSSSASDIPLRRMQSPSSNRPGSSSGEKTARSLWYSGPGRAEIRDEPTRDPGPGEVRVRALFSAISRGTERLVFAGRVPPGEYERMRAPLMGGA